jgi:hypothetical protein
MHLLFPEEPTAYRTLERLSSERCLQLANELLGAHAPGVPFELSPRKVFPQGLNGKKAETRRSWRLAA